MSEDNNNSMVRVQSPGAFDMRPRSLMEAMEYAKIIADTDMVPKDFRGKAGNVLIAVQMGQELGLPPLQALQSMAIINGRPALWGDGLLALVLAQPDLESFSEDDLDEIRAKGAATCVIKRRGRDARSVTFSIEDARQASLWGKQGPWSQYPARMLQMRARAFACRDVYADVLRGVRMAEEERDIEQAKRVDADVRDSQERERSTAKRVRAKLAAKIENAAPVTLQSVLDAIAMAETEADLMALGPRGQQLAPEHKVLATEAFRARREHLRAMAREQPLSMLERIAACGNHAELLALKEDLVAAEHVGDDVIAAYDAKAKALEDE